MRGRILCAAAVLAASPGCISDRCTLDDTARLLFVYPETQPPPDTTNPHVFLSIQDALDAAPPPEGEGVETTVCVADGVYREQLNVPAGVRLLGRGADRVRLRPPGGRDDEALILVEIPPLTSVQIEDVDISGTTRACIEARGGGTVTVLDSRIHDCGTGVFASGGGSVGRVRVQATPLARNGLAIQAFAMAEVSLTSTDVTGNGNIAILENVGDDGETPGFVLEGAGFADNGGGIVIRDGLLDIRSAEVRDEGRAEPPGGTGSVEPLFRMEQSVGRVNRLDARIDAGRRHFEITDTTLDLRSSGFVTPPSDDGDRPVLLATASTITAAHVTIASPGAVFEGDGASRLDVVGSIAWGAAVAIEGDAVIDVRSSLFQDPTVPTTTGNLDPADPQLDGLAPSADSPARCAASAEVDAPVDLRGNPRPFTAGKTPDVGAVELQQGCP